jgi:FkbM family methyltransferase
MSQYNYFLRLKSLGFEPDLVLDIGAFFGTWTLDCLRVYPNAKYVLFEPAHHNFQKNLDHFNNVKIIHTILNSEEKEVDWYGEPNGGSGDSFFKERTKHFTNTQAVKKQTTTLENELKKENIQAKSVFIKMDTQGSEIEILKGAGTILNNTDFIILEMPFFGQYNEGCPSFREYINFLDSKGFVPFEIADIHYGGNPAFQIQIDLIFINKNHKLNNIVQQSLMV